MSLDVGELVAYLSVDDAKMSKGLKDGETQFRRFGAGADDVTKDVAEGYGKTADNKKTKADLAQGQGLFQQFGKTAVGVAGTIGAAYAALHITNFIKDAIESASDLAETQSKVDRIFGTSAQTVENFAKTASTKLGQTQQQALDAAATFALFGKGAGLTGNDLSAFSIQLVGLATDLASFANTDTSQSIEALGAALRGESEPLRAYGVLLDQNVIAAEAVAHGIVKAVKNTNEIKGAQLALVEANQKYNASLRANGPDAIATQKAQLALANAQDKLTAATAGSVPELTKQQTVLATQAAILDQTKDAQGDFARTAGGLANQQRSLNAQWKEAGTSLGTTLLPVAVQFAHVLSDLAGGLKDNQEWLVPLLVSLGAFATVIWLIKSAIEAWTVVQWLLNIAMDANPVGLLILGIGLLVAGILLLWNNSAGFRDFFIGLWADIWGVLKGIGAWFSGPFAGFFVRFWDALVAGFKGGINNLVDSINIPLRFIDSFVIGNLNKIPGVNIGTIPLIPRLAKGGIVPATPGGRLVVAGDGNEDEAVIPLSRLRGNGSGSDVTVRLVLSGEGELTRAIVKGIRQTVRIGGGRVETVLVGA